MAITKPVLSIGVQDEGLRIDGRPPLYAPVRSPDGSIKVTMATDKNGTGFHDIAISIVPDGAPFIVKKPGGGTQILAWNSGAQGLLQIVNGSMSAVPLVPLGVLVAGPGGCGWSQPGDEDSIFGYTCSADGSISFRWFSITKREPICPT